MAWAKLDSNTLTGTAASISSASYTSTKFQMMLFHNTGLNTNPGDNGGIRFNGNGNSVYAARYSYNGGADGTATSATNIASYDANTAGSFQINYVVNITGEEKLTISFIVIGHTAGAGTSPRRQECVGKFVPSPDADITSNSHRSNGSEVYSIDTNLSTIGTD